MFTRLLGRFEVLILLSLLFPILLLPFVNWVTIILAVVIIIVHDIIMVILLVRGRTIIAFNTAALLSTVHRTNWGSILIIVIIIIMGAIIQLVYFLYFASVSSADASSIIGSVCLVVIFLLWLNLFQVFIHRALLLTPFSALAGRDLSLGLLYRGRLFCNYYRIVLFGLFLREE